MDKDTLAGKIEELQQQSQQRLNALAQGDSVWANLQGQIVAYNEMLGAMNEQEKTKDSIDNMLEEEVKKAKKEAK